MVKGNAALMKIYIYLIICFFAFIRTDSILAEELAKLPLFEEYNVEQSSFILNPVLDISEYEDKFYKNILIKEYENDADLANKYLVINVSCGANCHTNFIANKETGKIIGNIGTTLNLDYKIDSSLLIADKYNLSLEKPFYKNPIAGNVRYYLIKNDTVELLSQLSQQDYYNIKKSELNNAN